MPCTADMIVLINLTRVSMMLDNGADNVTVLAIEEVIGVSLEEHLLSNGLLMVPRRHDFLGAASAVRGLRVLRLHLKSRDPALARGASRSASDDELL